MALHYRQHGGLGRALLHGFNSPEGDKSSVQGITDQYIRSSNGTRDARGLEMYVSDQHRADRKFTKRRHVATVLHEQFILEAQTNLICSTEEKWSRLSSISSALSRGPKMFAIRIGQVDHYCARMMWSNEVQRRMLVVVNHNKNDHNPLKFHSDSLPPAPATRYYLKWRRENLLFSPAA